MDILIKAAQLILSLSILVVLHELGHFIPAKIFKTRVEKFYLFFDPWFSLFKVKKGETEYGVGWLPLGGYVKISGMVDESMDKEQMKQEPQPWEFRSKKTWQRLIIMIGGVTVNLFLGFFILSLVFYTWGRDWIPPENATYGMSYDSLLVADYGFQDGDKLIALNGEKQESIGDFKLKLLLEDVREITVERSGNKVDIPLPEDFGQVLVDYGLKTPFAVRGYTVIDSLVQDMPAIQAGLEVGDSLVAINGEETEFFMDFYEELHKYPSEEITLAYYRNGLRNDLKITPTPDGTIGFLPKGPETVHKDYSFGAAWGAGFKYTKQKLSNYVVSLKFLFSKAGAKQIGGFGTIGNLFPAKWNWRVFWELTSWLSLVLAFMNILPIPALDGGHVLFLLVEMITGRKPSDKFLERAQIVGMVILLSLLLYANGMDAIRAWFN